MNELFFFKVINCMLIALEYVPIDGVQRSSRIIGGRFVNIENYSYQVYLHEKTGIWWCGASIIGKNWAITAAHCVAIKDKESFVILSNSSFDNISTSGAIMHEIQDFKIHELYKYQNLGLPDYDIAVIKIKGSFFLRNSAAKSIELPVAGTKLNEGDMVVISGWGLTEFTRNLTNQLQAVRVPIMKHSKCKRLYARISWNVTDSMVCAGYKNGGKGACHGDSGGPMVINDTLIGIVSGAYRCAMPNYPEVFADVGFFRNWIAENTGI